MAREGGEEGRRGEEKVRLIDWLMVRLRRGCGKYINEDAYIYFLQRSFFSSFLNWIGFDWVGAFSFDRGVIYLFLCTIYPAARRLLL